MPLLTLTYKNSGYGVASKENYRFLFFRDGEFIVKKLTKIGHEFSLVPEVGSTGNFHWHASVRVKDPIGLKRFLQTWEKKHGYTKLSMDDAQRRQSVKFITPQMEAKLNVHLYLRKSTNETYKMLGFKAKAFPPKVRIISKNTKKWYRSLRLVHLENPAIITPMSDSKFNSVTAWSSWFGGEL